MIISARRLHPLHSAARHWPAATAGIAKKCSGTHRSSKLGYDLFSFLYVRIIATLLVVLLILFYQSDGTHYYENCLKNNVFAGKSMYSRWRHQLWSWICHVLYWNKDITHARVHRLFILFYRVILYKYVETVMIHIYI